MIEPTPQTPEEVAEGLSDAMKQAIKFAEELMNEGKEIYLVELKDKDPSSMGFVNFTKLIQKSFPLTQYELMEKKLSLL